MLDNQIQEKLVEYYQADMMRQAAEARRAKTLQAANGNKSSRKPVLARVGKALSTMGDNLQERYGVLDKQATQQSEYQLPA